MTAAPAGIYANKGTALPRFAYRNCIRALMQQRGQPMPADGVRAPVHALLQALETGRGDTLKFKYVLPEDMRAILTPQELQLLDARLGARGQKYHEKFRKVYPHCADEFSVSERFLEACFGDARLGLLNKDTQLFTMGSCFALNIAQYLEQQGYQAKVLRQMEDVNSPLSNAKLLAFALLPQDQRMDYARHWLVETRYEEQQIESVVAGIEEWLMPLHQGLRSSDMIILTVGNNLDFFFPEGQEDIALAEVPVAPKFLGIMNSEDISKRASMAKKLASSGFVFRQSTFEEARDATTGLLGSLRRANPTAHIVVTLSPVPIDSAIGISGPPDNAVEIDVLSKCTLRAVIHAALETKGDSNISYFPSFDIVRWIGPQLGFPLFGKQDAASRHVSEEVLLAVYAFFMRRYGGGAIKSA